MKKSIQELNQARAAKAILVREIEKARFNPSIDPGAEGRKFELDCARPLSTKKKVSKQGEADIKICFNGKYIPAECKTNGGRVDDLLDGSNKSKFVIYRLDVIQKHKAGKKTEAWDEHRYIAPVIIPTPIFLECLLECNAFKDIRKGGKLDGIGIQCSSKKLYQRLLAWPVRFDNTKDYISADFEGLKL